MSLRKNTTQLVSSGPDTTQADSAAIEYHLLSWRELYDKSIVTADRYSSGAGEWIIRGDKHFYTVTVISHPYYELPQELCLSFDCFIEHTEIVTGTGSRSSSTGPPIERVVSEFIALLSVFAREPLFPLGLRRVNDKAVSSPTHHVPPQRKRQSRPPPIGIDSPEVVSILRGLVDVPEATVSAVIGAAHFYHTALSLIGFDPSGAYVSLVSSIECLAGHHYKNLPMRFQDVEKFKKVGLLLKSISASAGGEDLTDQIKQELLKREYFLHRKFLRFIQEFLPEEFWQTPDDLYPYQSAFPEITKPNLVWCLRKVYEARSRYVHGGSPFPAYVEFGFRDRVPVEVSVEMSALQGKKRFLPAFSWFERVVHLVMVEYMLKKLAPGAASARDRVLAERKRLLEVITGLPEQVQKSLEKLATATAQFLGTSVLNPHIPNKKWADSAETVQNLLSAGIIEVKGEGLEGAAWLKNRVVGEAVGEFVYGSRTNPFRQNELLLPQELEKGVE